MSLSAEMTRRDHAELVGDGFLLTVGTASVAVAAAFLISIIRMPNDAAQAASEVGSGALMLAAGITGVILAWRLNGRRVDAAAVVGAALGNFIGASSIFVVAGISWLLGLPLKLVTDWEFAGPVATLALVSLGVSILILWLVADAIRDLSPGKREHVDLDKARIAAFSAFAVLVAVSVYLVIAQPGPEQGEAPIFAMAGGLIGAGAIAGADIATGIMKSRPERPLNILRS